LQQSWRKGRCRCTVKEDDAGDRHTADLQHAYRDRKVLDWTKLLLLLPWHTECSRAGNASVLGGMELVAVVVH
jgi:hypothetical protein